MKERKEKKYTICWMEFQQSFQKTLFTVSFYILELWLKDIESPILSGIIWILYLTVKAILFRHVQAHYIVSLNSIVRTRQQVNH